MSLWIKASAKCINVNINVHEHKCCQRIGEVSKIWWLKSVSRGLALKPGYAREHAQSEKAMMVDKRRTVQPKVK